MVDVSIIIPIKNEEKNVGICLNRIFNQKYDGEFEVILIDSGSTDKTIEIARNFPVRVISINPHKFRYGFVRNLGAARSRGNILVYLAGDAYPKNEQWLTKLVSPLEYHDNSKVVGVYGRQVPREGALPMERFHLHKFFSNKPIKFTNPYANRIHPQGIFFSTTNCAIKKNVWKKYRFSEKLLMHDDLEWARSVLFDGYEVIYNPEAVVVHSHHYTLKTAFIRFFKYGYATKDTLLSKSPYQTKYFIKDGIKYIIEEILFLLANKYTMWLPYALLYEFMKFLGFLTGKELAEILRFEKFILRSSRIQDTQK